MKLPKQWKRWSIKAGLKSTYSTSLRREYGDSYFKGHGRYWRVDCYGNLDMSEPFSEFDRWANSLEASVPMVAKNEHEFVHMVRDMLEEAGQSWSNTI